MSCMVYVLQDPQPLHKHADALCVRRLAARRINGVAKEPVHRISLSSVHRALHRMTDQPFHILRRRIKLFGDRPIDPLFDSVHPRFISCASAAAHER